MTNPDIHSEDRHLAGGVEIWDLDPAQSSVALRVKNWLVKEVTATLSVAAGRLVIGGSGSAHLQATVDAGTFTTGHAKRDEHVRSAMFLDVATYPTIEFAADIGDVVSPTEIRGALTVLGVTSPVALQVVSLQRQSDDLAVIGARTALRRRAVGVRKMPRVMAGDLVRIDLVAVLRRS